MCILRTILGMQRGCPGATTPAEPEPQPQQSSLIGRFCHLWPLASISFRHPPEVLSTSG